MQQREKSRTTKTVLDVMNQTLGAWGHAAGQTTVFGSSTLMASSTLRCTMSPCLRVAVGFPAGYLPWYVTTVTSPPALPPVHILCSGPSPNCTWTFMQTDIWGSTYADSSTVVHMGQYIWGSTVRYSVVDCEARESLPVRVYS